MYAWQMHFVTLLFVGLSGKEAEKRSKLCSTVVLVLLLPWMLLGLLLLLLCFNVHLLIVTLSLMGLRILYLQSKHQTNKVTSGKQRQTRRGGAIAVDVNANVLYPRSDEEDLQDESSEEDCERDDSFDESCGVEVD
ncbi:uncharacterized protein [Penaeus vannamei]